ncbi:cyclin-D3-1-like protein [Cinnamomum micranthum f. kanehirae]|uniref:Cyclin-D3-1-like protein n=1 Tax=Cinnamomum micranthum f. kanehirae TaxID=337451 RepID=A0A3S3MD49_9MAGN|nr:cyclin-D3-1-like protein [Cinnamomum micranthum f. kanehirae]
MTLKRPQPLLLFGALYSQQEEHNTILSVEDKDEEEIENSTIYPLSLCLEEDNLLSLFSKEQEPNSKLPNIHLLNDPLLSSTRIEAVEWICRVVSHFSFSALTALLSVNYLDRFLVKISFQRDKPWMTHLTAVACLSLAVKIQETQVPLLLDLQVKGARYVFEGKTIQRMELMVLSKLQWEMNPVTPLSFIEHIVRMLGLKTHQHWDFFGRCESLMLSFIADSRVMCCLPSVIAAATVLHVMDEMELCNSVQYGSELLDHLNLDKEKVEHCWQLIQELRLRGRNRRWSVSPPASPDSVMGLSSSCESSDEWWESSSTQTP